MKNVAKSCTDVAKQQRTAKTLAIKHLGVKTIDGEAR